MCSPWLNSACRMSPANPWRRALCLRGFRSADRVQTRVAVLSYMVSLSKYPTVSVLGFLMLWQNTMTKRNLGSKGFISPSTLSGHKGTLLTRLLPGSNIISPTPPHPRGGGWGTPMVLIKKMPTGLPACQGAWFFHLRFPLPKWLLTCIDKTLTSTQHIQGLSFHLSWWFCCGC